MMTSLTWPPGGSEMAQLIRKHDWASTPLGAVGSWPQGLRVTARVLLTSRHPMFIYWGPELIQLYNDAYRETMGPEKHPAALGSRGPDTWSEIWGTIGPQIAQVMAGGPATWHENQLVPVTRHGQQQEVWWTYSFSPIDDETAPGGIGGVLVVCRDVTMEHLARRAMLQNEIRQGLILKVDDALRPLTDAEQVKQVAACLLGEHLQVDRAAYAELLEDGESLVTGDGFLRQGVASIADVYRAVEFGRFFQAVQSGGTAVIEDARTDASVTSFDETWGALGIRAAVAHPIMKHGRLVAVLYVHSVQARSWLPPEVALVAEIAERTWDAVERSRAETALRESEERQTFLLRLTDETRPLIDPVDVQKAAMRLLADQLDVMRATYFEVDDNQDGFMLMARSERDPAPMPERMCLSDFAPDMAMAFRAGRTLVFRDTEMEAQLGSQPAAYRPIGIRAWAAVPLVKSGKLLAIVGVHSRTPRNWTGAETQLLEAVAERTWATVERARAEAALRESEERQRMTLRLVPALLWQADTDARTISSNERWQEHTGQSEAEAQDFGWLQSIHPADVEETRAAFDHAFATGEPLERQQRIHTAGNGYRWHLVRHVPVRDANGDITRWFGAAIDIHELFQLQDRQAVMVKELQHRTRNLITVINALSRQTLRNASSLADFEQSFETRLSALSRVQGLLSHLSAGKKVAFDELLHSELAALGAAADKVTLDGPAGVPLRSAMVQTFSLALHELATNALKYGALAAPDGHLSIRWAVSHDDGKEQRLRVDWRETGVSMVHDDERRRGTGYGRELIEKALPYQLDAETTYEMMADGVYCTIDVPTSMAAADTD